MIEALALIIMGAAGKPDFPPKPLLTHMATTDILFFNRRIVIVFIRGPVDVDFVIWSANHPDCLVSWHIITILIAANHDRIRVAIIFTPVDYPIGSQDFVAGFTASLEL
ncbi:hypothetical protein D5R40_31055 [Okeania hirsuta]|uniref:Uncharacterized protein n=1 Tax=Okeania hirsuta TaxID=1458930 RepID=A0A3N6R5Q2_9CYAN|nr:hypothetical protein D5R40_31055 [Okeania hirsuta]